MRSRLAHWSSQLSDSIIRVPPWIPLPHRQRGQAAGRPHARTLVHCGARRSCTHDTTAHGPCSRQRRGWGAALTVGVLLTWLVSVPGPIAARTPHLLQRRSPRQRWQRRHRSLLSMRRLGRQPSPSAWAPPSHGSITTATSTR